MEELFGREWLSATIDIVYEPIFQIIDNGPAPISEAFVRFFWWWSSLAQG